MEALVTFPYFQGHSRYYFSLIAPYFRLAVEVGWGV